MDDTMNKRPAFQFYPADWRKDPQLQMCDMKTQGVWINILCCMWEADEEGKLTGTYRDFARLLGISIAQIKHFVQQVESHKFADVTNCDGNVTIINRRMNNVFLERERAKTGMRKTRVKQSYKDVTPHSSTSSSTSKNIYDIFDAFRKKYPGTKRGLEEEFETFTRKHKDWQKSLDKLLPALEQQILRRKSSAVAGEFVPPWKHLKTWLNNRCWTEELIAPDELKTRRLCDCGCGKASTFYVGDEWFAAEACRKKVLGW